MEKRKKQLGETTFHSGLNRDNPFGLTDRQANFINEYLVDFNASRACRVTGVPRETVASWLKYDQVNKAIDAYLEKRRRENEELVKMTLEELKTVMTSDIRDYVKWDDHNNIDLIGSADLKNSKAIKGIEKTKAGVKLILHDKVRSIELMMQGLGMMKRPAIEQGFNRSDEGANFGTSLLEALTKAHDERRSFPKTTGGLLEVDAKFKKVKEDDEDAD